MSAVTRRVRMPDATLTMNTTMERLGAGETSAPVSAPAHPPAQDYHAPAS
jgi:hypothetical protein